MFNYEAMLMFCQTFVHMEVIFMTIQQAVKKYKLEPTIICESDGTMAEDAKKMKEIDENLEG